jgi:tetratricopeptide (TPR) repeat protein
MKILATTIIFIVFSVNVSAKELDPIQLKYNECMEIMASENTEKTIKCFEEVLRLDSKSTNTMYYLGELYGQNEQYGKSVESFENLLEIDPADKWAINSLIPSLDRAGMIDKSLKVAEKAANNFPEHAGFYAYLITRYQNSNEIEKVYKAREKLLSLVAENKFDGLISEKLYVREKFNVGDNTIYGIEYFRINNSAPSIFSFITKFPDDKERTYRVTYNDFMEEMIKNEQGPDALPYFFDAFDGSRQSLVTAFIHEPNYEELKKVVIKDLTEGRNSFRECVGGSTSRTPASCE